MLLWPSHQSCVNADFVADGLAAPLLIPRAAEAGVGDVVPPVFIAEQTTAVQLNTGDEEEELVPPTDCRGY